MLPLNLQQQQQEGLEAIMQRGNTAFSGRHPQAALSLAQHAEMTNAETDTATALRQLRKSGHHSMPARDSTGSMLAGTSAVHCSVVSTVAQALAAAHNESGPHAAADLPDELWQLIVGFSGSMQCLLVKGTRLSQWFPAEVAGFMLQQDLPQPWRPVGQIDQEGVFAGHVLCLLQLPVPDHGKRALVAMYRLGCLRLLHRCPGSVGTTPTCWPSLQRCDDIEEALLLSSPELIPWLKTALLPESTGIAALLGRMAASWGSTGLCCLLVTARISPLTFNAIRQGVRSPASLLQAAASFGHVGACAGLLQAGADPLHAHALAARAASEKGHVAVCSLLLEHQPHPHRLLVAAAAKGSLEVCQAILAHPVNPIHADVNASKALCAAAEEGHLAVCQLLLSQAHHAARADASDSIALHYAACNGHLDVCELLLNQPQNAAHADAGHGQVLETAASCGNLGLCQLLLTQAQNAAHADALDSEALVQAAFCGFDDVCQLLLSQPEHAARANAQRSKALLQAAQAGHNDICHLLLYQQQHAAQADAQNFAAFQLALQHGHFLTLEILCTAWASDKGGIAHALASHLSLVEQLLLVAAAETRPVAHVCDWLLSQLAAGTPDRFISHFTAVLSAAIAAGHTELCATLLKHGMDATAEECQALVLAVQCGNVDICHLLVQAGAYPDLHNYRAVVTAVRLQKPSIIQYFQEQLQKWDSALARWELQGGSAEWPPCTLPMVRQEQLPAVHPQQLSAVHYQQLPAVNHHQLPGAHHHQLPAGHHQQLPAVHHQQLPEMHHQQLTAVHQQQVPAVNHQQLPAVNHQQLTAVDHQQLTAVHHQQVPAVNHQQLPAVNHQQLPAVNQQQLTAVNHQQVPAVNHQQLPAVNHQQLTAVRHQQLIAVNDQQLLAANHQQLTAVHHQQLAETHLQQLPGVHHEQLRAAHHQQQAVQMAFTSEWSLMQAAAAGTYSVCHTLLHDKHNGCYADTMQSRALIEAARNGHITVCQLLLCQITRPARANAQNSLALVKAAANGHVDICRLLLQQPQHAARAGARKGQAMLDAACNGHLPVCNLLLTHSSIKKEPVLVESAKLAAEQGHVATLRVCFNTLTTMHYRDSYGLMTELLVLAAGSCHDTAAIADVCIWLLTAPQLKVSHRMCAFALDMAVRAGNVSACVQLLKHTTEPGTLDDSLLVAAIHNRKWNVVHLFANWISSTASSAAVADSSDDTADSASLVAADDAAGGAADDAADDAADGAADDAAAGNASDDASGDTSDDAADDAAEYGEAEEDVG